MGAHIQQNIAQDGCSIGNNDSILHLGITVATLSLTVPLSVRVCGMVILLPKVALSPIMMPMVVCGSKDRLCVNVHRDLTRDHALKVQRQNGSPLLQDVVR